MSAMLLLLLLWVGCGGEATRPHLTYSVREEQAPHTVLGYIGRDARLEAEYGPEVTRGLTYSLLRAGGRYAEFFSVDTSTGALRTAQSLDREALCQQSEVCNLQLDVAVTPVPRYHLLVIQVTITVLDVNDHAPVFPSQHISLPISESTAIGTEFLLPAAQDQDSQEFGVVRYQIETSTEPFKIVEAKSGLGGARASLKLVSSLDREKMSWYSLRLVAEDGGQPSRSGTLTVDITVVDSNDNSPEFLNASYEAMIREDTPPGTTICKVEAVDPDEGLNGQVVYRLAAESLAAYGTLFAINNATGAVYLLRQLDYETKKLYTLSVSAIDKGEGAQPGLTTLTVHVTDVNDNQPMVTINPLTASGRVEVKENSPPGQFVAHILVEDADDGANGRVVCSLEDSRFDIEVMFLNSYKITTAAQFDREKDERVTMLLRCTDQGNTRLETNELIVVDILDENDHSPVFSRESYKVSMPENSEVGAQVIRVNATDKDAGNNALLSYNLSPSARPYLAIENKTGKVYIVRRLDYERLESIDFKVYVQDHGNPARTASTRVILTIKDVNDEAPVFTEETYTFGTYEMQKPGTEIGRVEAIDADSPPFNNFTYKIDPNRSPAGVFKIDPFTGTITTLKSLDREAQPNYTMWILAVNPGGPVTLTSSVLVNVYVADVNDNAPMLIFPSPTNNTVYVPHVAPMGYVFSRILASDADIGVNARLTYSIAQGDIGGVFDVDSTTGAVSLRSKEPLEMDKYNLIITVSDNGDQEKTAMADLVVIVNRSLVVGSRTSDKPRAIRSYIASHQNQIIVISVAALCVLVVIILLVAIIVMKAKHHSDRRGRDTYKYACRPENAQTTDRQLQSEEEEEGDGEVPPPQTNIYQTDLNMIKRTVEGQSPKSNHHTPQNHHMARLLMREVDSDSTSGSSDSGRGRSALRHHNCSPPPMYDAVTASEGKGSPHRCVTFALDDDVTCSRPRYDVRPHTMGMASFGPVITPISRCKPHNEMLDESCVPQTRDTVV